MLCLIISFPMFYIRDDWRKNNSSLYEMIWIFKLYSINSKLKTLEYVTSRREDLHGIALVWQFKKVLSCDITVDLHVESTKFRLKY